MAGKLTVPAFLDERVDPYAQAIENLQREDLSPFDLAQFIADREREGDSRASIARKLHKPASFITEVAGLIDAPAVVRAAFDAGRVRDTRVLYQLARGLRENQAVVEPLLADEKPITRETLESTLGTPGRDTSAVETPASRKVARDEVGRRAPCRARWPQGPAGLDGVAGQAHGRGSFRRWFAQGAGVGRAQAHCVDCEVITMAKNTTNRGNVVYLRPADARAAKLRRLAANATDVICAVARMGGSLLALAVVGALQMVRLVLCALLVLIEPLVRVILVSIAFLSFVVTLIFGVLIGDARFPTFGMLAFSVGALWLYWLFVAFMSLFMRLPRGQD